MLMIILVLMSNMITFNVTFTDDDEYDIIQCLFGGEYVNG